MRRIIEYEVSTDSEFGSDMTSKCISNSAPDAAWLWARDQADNGNMGEGDRFQLYVRKVQPVFQFEVGIEITIKPIQEDGD